MGERPGCLEASNIRYGRVRPDIKKHLCPGEDAGAAVLEMNLDCLRRDEAPGAHDQLRARRAILLEMKLHLAVNHVRLALSHGRHIGLDGPRDGAELPGVMRQV